MEAYSSAIGLLPPGAEPEVHGLLLLSRGLLRQAVGDPAAMQDAIAALDRWRAAQPDWVAGALADVALAFGEDAEAGEVYWAAASRLSRRIDAGTEAAYIAWERGRRALQRGAYGVARSELERCESAARALDDDTLTISALLGLARVDLALGEPQAAARRAGEALALQPDPERTLAARWLLIDVAHDAAAAGLLDDAETALEQALAQASAEETALRERALIGLAGLARERGDSARALELGDEIAGMLRRSGDETGVAFLVHDLGVLAAEAGNPYEAGNHLNESLALGRRLRLPALAASSARVLAALASRRGDHLRALGFAEQAASFPLGGPERSACAATLAAIGADAERWKRHDVAIPAYAGAAELHRSQGELAEAERCEASLQRVRDARMVAGAQRDRVDTALEAARRLTDPGV